MDAGWRPRLLPIPEDSQLVLTKPWWIGVRPAKAADCLVGKIRLSPGSCALVVSFRHFPPPRRSVLFCMKDAVTQTEPVVEDDEKGKEAWEHECAESGASAPQSSHQGEAAAHAGHPLIESAAPPQPLGQAEHGPCLSPRRFTVAQNASGPEQPSTSAARLLAGRRSAAEAAGSTGTTTRPRTIINLAGAGLAPRRLCPSRSPIATATAERSSLARIGHTAEASPEARAEEDKAAVRLLLSAAYRRASGSEVPPVPLAASQVADERCEAASDWATRVPGLQARASGSSCDRSEAEVPEESEESAGTVVQRLPAAQAPLVTSQDCAAPSQAASSSSSRSVLRLEAPGVATAAEGACVLALPDGALLDKAGQSPTGFRSLAQSVPSPSKNRGSQDSSASDEPGNMPQPPETVQKARFHHSWGDLCEPLGRWAAWLCGQG